jgi:uncharacterized protein YtpQ (UPF0354 family)
MVFGVVRTTTTTTTTTTPTTTTTTQRTGLVATSIGDFPFNVRALKSAPAASSVDTTSLHFIDTNFSEFDAVRASNTTLVDPIENQTNETSRFENVHMTIQCCDMQRPIHERVR